MTTTTLLVSSGNTAVVEVKDPQVLVDRKDPIIVTEGYLGVQGLQGFKGMQGLAGFFAAQGVQGSQGPGFTWRSDWNNLAAYEFNDVVYHKGNSWIAVRGRGNSVELSNVSIDGNGNIVCSSFNLPPYGLIVGDEVLVSGSNNGTADISGYVDADAIDITGAIASGTTVTLNFPQRPTPPFVVGEQIIVRNIIPNDYNGYYIVSACTVNSVSYTSPITNTYYAGGSVSSYTLPKKYYIVSTNGSTEFVISASLGGSPIGVVPGTISGTMAWEVATGFGGVEPALGAVQHWSLMTSQGIQGIQGIQGMQGMQGIQGLQGRQGPQGYSIVWKSTYSNTKTYYVNNVVFYEGTSWIAVQNNFTGVAPLSPTGSSYWEPLSSQGVQGIQSIQGPQGVQGIQGGGIQGPRGALDPWIKITGNYIAKNANRLIADTSAGTFTVSLPAAPVLGDYVIITDGKDFSINPLLISTGGSFLENYIDDVLLDLPQVTYEFIYDGTEWQVTATTGHIGVQGWQGIQGFGGIQGLDGRVAYKGDQGIQGIQGIQGPQGVTGTSVIAGNYLFEQLTPSDTWFVAHNLDVQYVTVQIYNTNDETVDLGTTSVGASYTNIVQTSTTGGGSGFLIDVVRTGGTGTYAVTLAAAGTLYNIGDTVTFAGTLFGGASPANDIVVSVTSIDAGGGVDSFTYLGTATYGNPYITAVDNNNLIVHWASGDLRAGKITVTSGGGVQGIQGPGFSWKGMWSPSSSYIARDVVNFNGSTYVNILNYTPVPLSGLDITTTGISFSALATPPTIGLPIIVTGTNSGYGSLDSYSTNNPNGGKVYYIINSTTTAVTLSLTSGGPAVTNIAGIPTGLNVYLPSYTPQVHTSQNTNILLRVWSLLASQGVQGLDGKYAGQGIQGLQGIQGIQGQTAIGGNYVHEQIVASDSWFINHNLGTKFIIAQAYNDNDETVEIGNPDVSYIEIVNENNIILRWAPGDNRTGKLVVISGGGIQGLEGPQGISGSAVYQGDQGIQGFDGIQGPQGPQGMQGVQGIQGEQGIQGIDGLYAAQGIQGIQGIQGDQGVQGVQGVQGLQGYQAFQGVQGLQGLQGVQGPLGKRKFILGTTGIAIGDGVSSYVNILDAPVGYNLYKIRSTQPAWITIYTNIYARINDSARPYYTDPTPDSGVIVEVITNTVNQTVTLSPAILGFIDPIDADKTIAMRVMNLSGSANLIDVELTVVPTEENP